MSALVESIPKSQHGTWIEIRLDRLHANLRALKDHVSPATRVMAVVKANAYGHGLIDVAQSLSGEVSYLGVASLREALLLKEHRIETPVFIFGRLFPNEIPAAILDGITLSVSSLEEAVDISEVSSSFTRKTPVHIKVDTGMGRLGIPLKCALPAIEQMAVLQGIQLEGIYTHFPTAERDDGFRENQTAGFSDLIRQLAAREITFSFHHTSNSAGILKADNSPFNLIRPGLMLYGIYPDASLADHTSVAPVLSLKSRIILVKRLATGESAGYSRDFVARRPATIAVIPVGYSHGYPFSASNKAEILYQGRRFSIAGRVSMDYLTVNLGDAPAHAGDEVTLIGEDEDEIIRAEDVARWAGTIPYEIVTRLVGSLPRVYKS